jgi:quinoprotein glucose dehydrogenase
MSLDNERGMVFIPTGSAAFDFYGGNRKGANLFANCLIALNAATGERIWHYQLVHHDLWDYDLPAPPVLVTINNSKGKVDAVAQTTKMGMVFLFERETGNPIFSIVEKPVTQSDLIGEETSLTQPFPEKPLPFVRHHFSEEEITNITPEANAFVREKLRGTKTGSIYTPPSVEGSVQFPGTRGGAEWGGASFDPETNILYVNANEVAMLFKMKPVESNAAETMLQKGERMYAINNCTSCHGAKREGVGVIPSLQNVSTRLTKENISSILRKGKGQMPSFPNLSSEELDALVTYLTVDNNFKTASPDVNEDTLSSTIRYVHEGWNVLADQDGYPGVKPPWGTLNAIDLNSGELLWKIPLGEFAELSEKGFLRRARLILVDLL